MKKDLAKNKVYNYFHTTGNAKTLVKLKET